MAEVVLEHVWKYYPGNVAAVQDFNLTVHDREFAVLVGPSGCGKSTTLRMIAGLEEVSRGSVRIGARVVNDIPPKDRDIAMVFQNYALYPHMTVYENMAFGLRLRRFKRAEIERRVREAAEILGITEYLQRRPKALSGGQRQRVAVGRAIVRKPAAFLFDEPLSNLDAKLRVQMRTEISKLHKRLAATMIYVTHDQVEAMTMGDRIVVMKDGVAQQVDAPLKIYEAPANLFVAGFIGMPPMNFFTGAVAATGGRPVFRGARAELALPAAWRGAAEKLAGAPAVLGIRPENIGSIAAAADPAAPRLAARVELVELMGSETYLHLRSEAEPFIARVDAHEKFQVGQDCRLPVAIERAHLFDARTGANLTALNK